MANFSQLSLTMTGPQQSIGAPSTTNITSSAYSNVLDEKVWGSNGLDSFWLSGTVDVNTPAAAVSASASQVTDGTPEIVFTTTLAHGLSFGLVVQFTTSVTLPTNIVAATDYYVVPITATTYTVATTLALAISGTYVAYSDTGTGNQTATPVALAGGNVALQGSNDNGATWVTVPNSTVAVTADGQVGPLEIDYVRYASYRVYAYLTTGMMAFSNLRFGYRGN